MTKIANNSKILLYKGDLRKEIFNRLRSQPNTERLKKSLIIQELLFKSEKFRKARCVAAYVSMTDEVDTHQIIDESIRMGKVVGVPLTISDAKSGKKDLIISQITDRIRQLEIGPYGIRRPKANEIRPIPYKNIDLVLVPGLSFDIEGNRLGRGKGYYDRFLKKLPKNALTIGLCFDFQIQKSVPTLPHDIPVRMLISN
ncbi:MAG: 5-formyltetrahydrofolate cyclo-ligase [Candidatus Omnitrophica bacterium]|nr:5-formyltetrahydrofolate cyclo-ligase [Candidatus Omnitrophota bacterium]